ncbi:MAG: Sensor protein ZraS [Pseudomonadota bacterium]|jgi:two-component system sensor histidine kinase PilS (NtrC family)
MAAAAADTVAGADADGLPSWLRSFQYFAIARIAIAVLLLAYVPLLRSVDSLGDHFDAPTFLRVSGLYLGAACVSLVLALRPGRLPLRTLAAAQVAVDLAALLPLIHASGGQSAGFAALLLLPNAGAAILVGTRAALSFAAVSTIALIAMAGSRALDGQAGDAGFVQAGLTGAVLIASAVAVGRLARRLSSQERLAWRRGEDLRNQLAVTQAVIADLPDGVVVLGPRGEPRAINRSAREMLAGGAVGGTLPGLLPMRAALGIGPGPTPAAAPADAIEFVVQAADGPERRLRARRLGVPAGGADVVVVLEDLGRLEARAQQLKLASMGRLSASIAHEIRNPLSAIRHANGLLAEQLGEPRLGRLATIVEDNCRRIDRIIEDVLSISRRGTATPEPIDARPFVVQAVAELVAQTGADPRRIECRVPADAPPLWFDAGNLRQVLLNLLGNALRHASGEAGAVRVEWAPEGAGRWTLVVSDDGAGVAAASRVHLFEPFFTTEARGTGLGLYLARELCTANGAMIRYRPPSHNPPQRSAFVVEPAAAHSPG